MLTVAVLTLVLTLVTCCAGVNVTQVLNAGCTFEEPCRWDWNRTVQHGFKVVNVQQAKTTAASFSAPYRGPVVDASNNKTGHFLLLREYPDTGDIHNVWSPKYNRTSGDDCRLEVALFMEEGNFKVVVEINGTSWVIDDRMGHNITSWERMSFKIGRVSKPFNIILEVFPTYYQQHLNDTRSRPSIVAIDNIRMTNCFSEGPRVKGCGLTQYRCNGTGNCIDKSKVCDFHKHCEQGDDEEQGCEKVPLFSHCDFENDWCGWSNRSMSHNQNEQSMNWTRHSGPTTTAYTGPSTDHTYGNSTGVYAFVDMAKKKVMGAAGLLESAVFNRPPSYHSNPMSPYYNSCHIRFHYHQYGPHSGSVSMNVVEMHPKDNRSTQLWWRYGDKGDVWIRQVVVLPNITRKYYIQFEARRGIAFRGDIALDDISMSPECFGIGVPPNELKDYDYNKTEPDISTDEHKDFVNKTYYALSTCGIEGRTGPKQANCTMAYNNTATRVVVQDKGGTVQDWLTEGVQEWVVPDTGYYTLIAKGARGGKGSDRKGSSHGASARTVLELHKGQKIYVLVGQEGTSACSKDLSAKSGVCQPVFSSESNKSTHRPSNPITRILKMEIESGGGGGGGGTYIFQVMQGRPEPLLVAGGGGGLGLIQGGSNTCVCLDDARQTGAPASGRGWGRAGTDSRW